MILRPFDPASRRPASPVSAWETVLETQHRASQEFWLVAQPDHAGLAGDIATALGPPLVPELSPEVVRGIAVHDDGWTAVDAQVSCAHGRPLSFLDVQPAVFLEAWARSIQCGEQVGAMAGAIVSRHFWRLGATRLRSGIDSEGDRRELKSFLAQEEARQKRLTAGHSQQEFEFLTDVLQFCDLLSLYLCCGAEVDAEFAQQFQGRTVSLLRSTGDSRRAAVCRFEPTPFRDGLDLGVAARHYPSGRSAQFAFLLS